MTENPTKVQIIQRPPLLEDVRKQQQFYNLSLRHFSHMYISLLKVGLSVGHEIRFVKKEKEKKKRFHSFLPSCYKQMHVKMCFIT
jgi:hypothetical protein